jgi:hypothetical protein
MLKKLSAITMLLGLLCVTPGLVNAAPPVQKKPVQNISCQKHPNLCRAQKQTDNAFKSITAAQQANEFDLAGHAAKAKELLDQANKELKQAAEVSNINHQ